MRSFIEYSRQQDNGRVDDDFQQTTCGRRMDQLEAGQTVMLALGQFARRTIDTIETFICRCE